MARKKKSKTGKAANPVPKTRKKLVKKSALLRMTSIPAKQSLIIFGLMLMLALMLYGSAINYGFVLDDKIVLSENTFTKEGISGIGKLLSTDSFQGYFGEQKEILQGGRYRPLSLVSFAIEYEFFGLNPGVFHFMNILLYAFSCFIAFFCLRRLFVEKTSDLKSIFLSSSFLITLLFLFHPIHTEAVANIKGRDEIMAFLFSISTLFYFLRYLDSRKYTALILACLMYFLGLLSKENTITFLAIIPLSGLLFRKKKNREILIASLALFIITMIYLFIRVDALGYLLIDNPSTDIMNNPFTGLSLTEKMATIAYTLLVYIKLVFVPLQLTHDYYPYHIPIMNFTNWQVWLSLLIHFSMLGSMVYFWKKRKEISYGIAFYIIALSIVSNIVVNVGTFMNERFIFTALLGMIIVLFSALEWLKAKIKAPLGQYSFYGLLTAIFLAYGFKTIDRVPAWKDELSLNKEAIKVSKNSARANSFMATAYFNRYKEISDADEKKELLQLARPHAEKAIEIYPNYYNGNLMLAGIAAEEFKYDRNISKLLSDFKKIARRRPDVEFLTTYLEYLNDRGDNLEALKQFYMEIGQILYEEEKNYTWAIHYVLLADSIFPNDPEIRRFLVKGYNKIGRADLADKFR